jgi:hypothetical protein
VYGGDSGAGARDENELVLKKAGLRKPRFRVIKGDELPLLRSAPNRQDSHCSTPTPASRRSFIGDLGSLAEPTRYYASVFYFYRLDDAVWLRCGPTSVGLALPDAAELPRPDGIGQAGRHGPMTSAKVSDLLALALKVWMGFIRSRSP